MLAGPLLFRHIDKRSGALAVGTRVKLGWRISPSLQTKTETNPLVQIRLAFLLAISSQLHEAYLDRAGNSGKCFSDSCKDRITSVSGPANLKITGRLYSHIFVSTFSKFMMRVVDGFAKQAEPVKPHIDHRKKERGSSLQQILPSFFQ